MNIIFLNKQYLLTGLGDVGQAYVTIYSAESDIV